MRAKIITDDGRVLEITPKQYSTFTLDEISKILDGPVISLFLNSYWFFHNPSAIRTPSKFYNNEAARLLSMPVYGDALIIHEDLLPNYFFVSGLKRDKNGNIPIEFLTDDIQKDLFESDEYDDDFNDDDFMGFENHEDYKLDLSEEEQNMIKVSFLKKYANLMFDYIFNKGYSIKDQIHNKLVVLELNGKKYSLINDNSKIKILDELLNHFIAENSEDFFEKSEKIIELINSIKEKINKNVKRK